MSQGQTVKGKTTSGRNVEIQVDEDGRLVIAGVTLDPAGLATVTKQDEIIAAIEGITIPPPVGGATLAEQQAQTALLTTIEANQLPDSHNVTVDNLPADYPLPAAQVTTLTPPAAITGFATQTTLAALLTELQLKADLSETQPVSLASVPSHAVTNVGTFAVQAAQSGTWNIGTLTSITNNVNTVEVAPTTIYNGNKNVTTAGTRVTLASSQAVKSVTIKAKIANTGTIYVGDGSVASSNGFALAAGETLSLDLANLNTVNLDASVSGEGVTYIGVN